MTITHNGAATTSDQRVCVGPLACYIDRFAEFLVCEGYTSRTVKVKRALVTDLSRSLARHGLPLARLDEQRLKQFHAYHRRLLRRGDVFTGHQLLEFLRSLGVISSLPQKDGPNRTRSDHSRLRQIPEFGARPGTCDGGLLSADREETSDRALREQGAAP